MKLSSGRASEFVRRRMEVKGNLYSSPHSKAVCQGWLKAMPEERRKEGKNEKSCCVLSGWRNPERHDSGVASP